MVDNVRRGGNNNLTLGVLIGAALVALAVLGYFYYERQREVVMLIAAGCSNDEVAARLGISPRTAKAHCDVLRQKLGVKRRRQIPIAYRLLTGDDPLSAEHHWGLAARSHR